MSRCMGRYMGGGCMAWGGLEKCCVMLPGCWGWGGGGVLLSLDLVIGGILFDGSV